MKTRIKAQGRAKRSAKRIRLMSPVFPEVSSDTHRKGRVKAVSGAKNLQIASVRYFSEELKKEKFKNIQLKRIAETKKLLMRQMWLPLKKQFREKIPTGISRKSRFRFGTRNHKQIA